MEKIFIQIHVLVCHTIQSYLNDCLHELILHGPISIDNFILGVLEMENCHQEYPACRVLNSNVRNIQA